MTKKKKKKESNTSRNQTLAMVIYKYDHPSPLLQWSSNEQALVRTEQWLYPFQVQLENPRAFCTQLSKKYILQFFNL